MSTIAYRNGVLAADTMATANGGVVSLSTVKIGGRNGVMWTATGDAAWGKSFRDWMASGQCGDIAKPDDHTAGLIFCPNNDIVVYHHTGIELRSGLPFWADGSGQDYALGAMQVGATPEQAVRAAMVWDRYTGGDITVLRREA